MNDWIEVKLSEIMKFNPREHISKGTVAKKISMDKIEPFTRDISGFEFEKFKGGTKFKNGDTIMARITPCLENGKIAKVNILDNDEIGFGSTEFIVLRPIDGVSDEDFVYYLMSDPCIREIAIKSMIGSSGRQRVQLDVLKNHEIMCPSLHIQKRIGKLLKSFDDKIENNKKINHHLEQMATSIWQERFSKLEANGTLADIAKVSSGKRPLTKNTEITDDMSIPILGASSIMGYTNQILYDEKILVTGRVGTHGVIQRYSRPCWASDNALVLTSDSYELVYQILKSIDFVNMNRGSTQPLITQTDLKKVPIFIPTSDELLDFESIVDPIMKQYEANILENENLTQVRDTLLPKLMSGELQATD